MKLFGATLLALALIQLGGAKYTQDNILHPDTGLNIYEFCEKYNYPIETHHVQTEDGYLLTAHRIPYGVTDLPKDSRPAVLIMHGLLSSSMDWVNMGPGKSLALMLADAGYDVWLGNNRGNSWSRNHTTLNPDTDKDFWDYSFHELGYYDDPAFIDYILETTGNTKLSYVGHSQGTSQFFAMASTRPEYNDKINVMAALAPVVYMQNLTSPFAQIGAKYIDIINLFLDTLGIHEVLPHKDYWETVGNLLCNKTAPTQEICADFLFLICGEDSPQLDRDFITVITSNAPAGASKKEFVHYGQEIISGHFRQYDYGLLNVFHYGQASPPDYNISKITAPVALFYSNNDYLSATVNVQQLAQELPNVEDHFIDYEKFQHLDYIWSIDIDTLLNNDVIAVINKANNK